MDWFSGGLGVEVKPATHSILQDQDGIHLHIGTSRQRGDANGGACRVGLRKIFGHDFVDAGKMIQIGQENIQLDDVA
jgi:hypothetical protein